MNTVLLGLVGPTEVLLIVAVLVLMFGAKKIPELMKGVGTGIKEFKTAMKEGENAADEEKKDQLK